MIPSGAAHDARWRKRTGCCRANFSVCFAGPIGSHSRRGLDYIDLEQETLQTIDNPFRHEIVTRHQVRAGIEATGQQSYGQRAHARAVGRYGTATRESNTRRA